MAAGPTFTPIATTTLGSAQSSVTFSSISGSYTDLVLVIAGTSSADVSYNIQLNSDTGSNYSYTYVYGDGSSVATGNPSNQTYMGAFGRTGTSQGNGIIHFMNYSNTTTNKTVIGRGSLASQMTLMSVGLWRSTAAITSIKLTPESGTISSGCVISLYGITAA
jgi:hypothetical protein